jgi:hypothetical protein
MPIVVAHQPDLGVVGMGALAAGYGQYQNQQREIARDQYNRDADRRLRAASMQQEQQNRHQQMQMAAYQQEAGRQHDFQLFGLRDEQMANRDATEVENRQMLANQQAEQQKQMWDYQWTAKQRAELEKFNNYEQSIQSSPTLNQSEKQQLLMELQGQKAGFRPMAVPKKPEQPSIDDMSSKGQWKLTDSWTDPATGQTVKFPSPVIMGVNRNGAPDVMHDFKQKTPEEMQHEAKLRQIELDIKQRDLEAKAVSTWATAQKSLEKVNPETGVTTPPSREEVEAHIQNSMRLAQGTGQAVNAAVTAASGGQQPYHASPSGGSMPGVMLPQQQMQQPAQPQQQQPQPMFSPVLGREVSPADIEETARKHGVTPQEVLQRLGIK